MGFHVIVLLPSVAVTTQLRQSLHRKMLFSGDLPHCHLVLLLWACVKGDHHGGEWVREQRWSPHDSWKVGKITQEARAQDPLVHDLTLLLVPLPQPPQFDQDLKTWAFVKRYRFKIKYFLLRQWKPKCAFNCYFTKPRLRLHICISEEKNWSQLIMK